MSYFNHAFSKRFLGTGVTRNIGSTGAAESIGNPYSTDGFVTTANMPTVGLSQLPSNGGALPIIGYYGFFDPKTSRSVNDQNVTPCCPLILASTSLLHDDKIGPFHGGYKETNKSKIINPKYVSKLYRVDSCEPQQTAISVGNTPYTDDRITQIDINTAGADLIDGTYNNLATAGGTGTGAIIDVIVSGGIVILVTLVDGGTGYTAADILTLANPLPTIGAGVQPDFIATVVSLAADCCREFLCDETYYLRVDVKGSPALRALNHNAYQTVSGYTGCCPTGAIIPVAVDSTSVFIQWAEQISTTVYLKDFVFVVVYDESGTPWFAPGTTEDPDGAPVSPAQWWNYYVSPGHNPGDCGGLRLFGAYVETKFGSCSFQVTDFFEKEPVKILASLVDYTGDPCVFEGLCVIEECPGLQGNGFGEQVLRDFILSESYLQNFFHTDIRIREITQGDDILNAIDRNALYTRYYIQHNVPRFNNPSGVFDNDQYMLEIITNNANPTLETFLTTWMGTCGPCDAIEVFSCGTCTVPPVQ